MAWTFFKDSSLAVHDILFFILNNEPLDDCFESHELAVGSAQIDLGEAPCPYALDDVKIAEDALFGEDFNFARHQLKSFCW